MAKAALKTTENTSAPSDAEKPVPEDDTKAPETPATPVVKHGAFTFGIKLTSGRPAANTRQPPSHALPFREWFTKSAPLVTEEVDANTFIPTRFWTEGRSVEPAKATAAYQKAKVREQFNQWRKEDEEGRSKFDLTTVFRPGDTEEDPEAGLEIWMFIPK